MNLTKSMSPNCGLDQAPTRVAWSVRFPQRGRIELPSPRGQCEQPFGLLRAAAPIGEPASILVLPALGKIESGLRSQLQRWLDQGPASDETGDDEIDHLRAYRPGDPPRRIHWRATARSRSLVVSERRASACRRLALVLDTATTHGRTGRRLERLISIAATLAVELQASGWHLTLGGRFSLTQRLVMISTACSKQWRWRTHVQLNRSSTGFPMIAPASSSPREMMWSSQSAAQHLS